MRMEILSNLEHLGSLKIWVLKMARERGYELLQNFLLQQLTQKLVNKSGPHLGPTCQSVLFSPSPTWDHWDMDLLYIYTPLHFIKKYKKSTKFHLINLNLRSSK
jgi:hypothetical protein